MKRESDDPVMQALLYPLDHGLVPRVDGSVLLVNPINVAGLAGLAAPDRTAIWQWWRGPADSLATAGYAVSPEPPAQGDFSLTALRVPQQRDDALFLLAFLWSRLRAGGMLMAAAGNDAGGRRLMDDLSPYLPGVQSASKHKSRIVWAMRDGATARALPADWLVGGTPRQHPATGFWTRPGLFSWDRIDAGTAMLLPFLATGLSGVVADLGCGMGVIADHVLATSPAVEKIICIDADARAVDAARKNLADRHPARAVEYHWADLSQDFVHPPVDHVVMNPPFHAEKITAINLGRAFIGNAARILRPGGTLTMVANAHLPYEDILAEKFASITRLHQAGGFKIMRAKR